MSDETTDEERSAAAAAAAAAGETSTPSVVEPDARAAAPRPLSQRPSSPPAFEPPTDEGWSDPHASDGLDLEPPTPRSAGVESAIPREAEDDSDRAETPPAPKPRASLIPLPMPASAAPRISTTPRAPAVPQPGPVIPAPAPLPAGLGFSVEAQAAPAHLASEGPVDSTEAPKSNGAEVLLAEEVAEVPATDASGPPVPPDARDSDRPQKRESDGPQKVEGRSDRPPKQSSSPAIAPPPPNLVLGSPPIVSSGDGGVSEETPKSLKPMRIISIGTSQPPQPEKRRGPPPPVEAIAKMLAPLNLPIDEAPDIEVEVSLAEDEEPESVEEILVDPEEAYPRHAMRSKPPPPPPRMRGSDAPPGAQKSDRSPEGAAVPVAAAAAQALADEADQSRPISIDEIDDDTSAPVTMDEADDDTSAPVTIDEADDTSAPVTIDEADDDTPAPSTVEEPAVSLAEVDVAPASEADVEGIEEAEPEPAKPPPPPKRRPQSSQPAAQEVDAPKVEAKKRKAWWEDLFTEDFARGTPLLSDAQVGREAAFIEESLGVAKGGIILDLACGVGQHAVELAKRGYSVVGLDLSLPQLAQAGELAQVRGQKINFLQGDMREMSFEETFDGIYCWNTSFGYFEEEKNFAVAQKIFRALRSGGSFLLDVVNRDFVVTQQPSSVWFEGDACVCMDDMSVDFITSRLRVKRTLMMDDGRTRECNYSIRVYSLHELGKMLHDIGFRVTEASGHPAYPGVFFGATSPRVIILAQKP